MVRYRYRAVPNKLDKAQKYGTVQYGTILYGAVQYGTVPWEEGVVGYTAVHAKLLTS